MQFHLPIQIEKPNQKLSYTDKILLIGSCFTEHIGNSLATVKFSVHQNPHGILFNPESVCDNLLGYIANKQYNEKDLFHLNEVWFSWKHHSQFGDVDKKKCLDNINLSQKKAHKFLKDADWLIITLGSAFVYQLTKQAEMTQLKVGESVANCHRAPAQWFNKKLIEINEIIALLESCFAELKAFNPKIKIILTISPVRHSRDGVVENNQSKARLIEAVHSVVKANENVYYFPAYELVMDVLRDYRFYDKDLIHPNYMATEFVFEKFVESFIDEPSSNLMAEVKKIVIARKHKPFQATTSSHLAFLKAYAMQTADLLKRYPTLDLQEELHYFTGTPQKN